MASRFFDTIVILYIDMMHTPTYRSNNAIYIPSLIGYIKPAVPLIAH